MSESTFSTSIATRDSEITSPARMLRADGRCGTCNATYFSPNNVFGTIRADTFSGMRWACAGSIARESVAPSPLDSIRRTSPTSSPRIFTSASAGSCRPTCEVVSRTGT